MHRLICLFLFLAPCHAYSTTVVSLSVDKMTKEADLIVRGVVNSRTTQWNQAKTRIYTITKIDIQETYKGSIKASHSISIRQIGGEIDGLVQTIAGNAKFSAGEEVIVFLESHPTEGIHFVMGMAQGKYSINRTRNPPAISRSINSLHRVNVRQIQPVLHIVTPTSPAPLPTLVSLVSQIQNALAPAQSF